MRGDDQLARVTLETPVVDVIKTMTSKRSGASVVIDAAGHLEGIFTHGDFARHFPGIPEIGSKAVMPS